MIKNQLVVLSFAAAVLCLISGQEPFQPFFDSDTYTGTECEFENGSLSASGVLSRLVEITEGEIKVRIFPKKLEPIFNEVILDATVGKDFSLFNDSDNFDCSCNATNPSNQNSTVVTFLPLQDSSSDFRICFHRDGVFEKQEKFSLEMEIIEITGNFNTTNLLSYPKGPIIDDFPVTVTIDDHPQDIVTCCIESESNNYEINVQEGPNRSVIISSYCDGRFEREIDIAISCMASVASGVDPALVNAGDDSDAKYDSSFKFLYLPSEEESVLASNSLNVSIIDDGSDANDNPIEQFICNLLVGAGEKLRAGPACDRVTVNIRDDDQIFVSWTRKFYNFTEDAINATTQLNSSNTFPSLHSVRTRSRTISPAFVNMQPDLSKLMTIPGGRLVDFMGETYETARSSGSDPQNDFVTTQVTFTFDMTMQSENNFIIIDDNVCEMDEIFAAFIQDADTNTVEPDVTFIIIEDNDRAEISFSDDSYMVNENAGSIEITVQSSLPISINTVVNITCYPENSSEMDFGGPYDYMPILMRSHSSPATATFRVPITDDINPESTECFICEIISTNGPNCAVIGRPNQTQICIKDNDDLVPVIIHNDTVVEGEKTNILLELESLLDADCSITVETTDGSARAPGDYVSGRYTVVIPARNKTAILMVMTNDDDIAELTETFTATIVDTCDLAAVGNPSTGYVDILDNDTIDCSKASQSLILNEGNTAEITVNCFGQYDFNFSLLLDTTDRSAVAPSDYTPGGYSLPFSGGQNSTIQSVNTVADSIAECDESFQTKITRSSRPEKVNIVDPDTCDVVIEDNDVLMVMFEPVDYEVSEGETANVMLVTNLAYSFNFSVVVACVNGSAFAPGDFIAEQYTVDFPASLDGPGKASIAVRTLTDNVLEDMEFLKCNILEIISDEACSVLPGPDNMARVNITDDMTITCSKAPENATVTEGGVAGLTVVCSGQSEFNFTLFLDTMDGSAVAPGDYTSGGYSLSFTAGQTSAVLFVSTSNDTIAELDEFFKVMITGSDRPDKVIIGDPDTCFVTIQDNDVITCSKAPENATVTEGGVAGLTVECSGEYEFNFTLFLDTMDGSAVAPGDYTSGGYSLSFSAGDASDMLSVQTSDDTVAELEEFFKVMITGSDKPDKVIIGDPDTCFVTIQDNDVITCSKAPENATVTEGGVAGLSVECSGDYEFDFTLFLDNMDGSAVAPGDYTSGGYSLSFSAGQTLGTLSVQTSDDTVAECDEFFKVMITRSNLPEKVLIGDPNTCYVTIEDDDAVQINFAEVQYTVREGDEVILSLNINGCLSSKCLVDVKVSGGNAKESLDFTGVPVQIEIPPRVEGLDFTFKAVCDNITEGVEFVELALEIPSQNECRIEAIAPNTTRVNILDICRDIPEGFAMPVNDSVIADPLYTVPLCTMNTSNIIEGTPLCYEVHGRADHYFNLVSDDCTSVNAHYVAAVRPRAGNVIGQIGIVTSDRSNRCHRIQVDVTSDGQCQTQINGVDISGTIYNNNITRVIVMAGRRYVRVSTPNCVEQDLVMWIRCHIETLNRTGDSFEQPMIKFVVTRGLQTRSEAHGLIGQFWGVCINVTRYTGGFLPSAQAHSGAYYTLQFNAINPSQRRTFTAKLGWTTWRLGYIPTLPGYQCFYAGNSQGGRSIEATDSEVQDSVIEGKYEDYIASGLFDTQWHDEYSRFTAVCNFTAT